MDKKKIERINFLAKKSRESGLTPDETTEREQLRAEYIASIRSNFKATLDSIKFTDSKGESKQ